MARAKKAKKDKPLYDANGNWVEERGRVKGAIRRTFRLSPQMKEVLQAARVELPPALKKDGEPGKKNQVRYRCACCGELFSQKFVQVDHIEPVVPLWMPEVKMTYDQLVRGVFCKKENLQVVCSTPIKFNGGKTSCHRLKTNEENFIRDELGRVTSLLDHTGEEIDALIEKAKEKHKLHLAAEEEKKRAKLARRNRIKNQ